MTNYSYADAWSDCRHRFRLFWLSLVVGFLVAGSLIYVLSLFSAPSWLLLAISMCWIVGFIYAAMRLQLFRCPRCQERFFSGTWYYWPLARACVHCGLPKWQQ
jgi:hypothetical protein